MKKTKKKVCEHEIKNVTYKNKRDEWLGNPYGWCKKCKKIIFMNKK